MLRVGAIRSATSRCCPSNDNQSTWLSTTFPNEVRVKLVSCPVSPLKWIRQLGEAAIGLVQLSTLFCAELPAAIPKTQQNEQMRMRFITKQHGGHKTMLQILLDIQSGIVRKLRVCGGDNK
jgi:hypothetical protein